MEWMNIFTNPITCISAVLIVAMIIGLIIFLTIRGVKIKINKFSVDTQEADSNTRYKVSRQIDYVHYSVSNISPAIEMLLSKYIEDSHLKRIISYNLQLKIEISLIDWITENHIGKSDIEIENYCRRKVDLLIGMIHKFFSSEIPEYKREDWDDIAPKLKVEDIDNYVFNCLFKTIKNAKAEADNIDEVK